MHSLTHAGAHTLPFPHLAAYQQHAVLVPQGGDPRPARVSAGSLGLERCAEIDAANNRAERAQPDDGEVARERALCHSTLLADLRRHKICVCLLLE